jgi:hypothetical protein
MKQRNNDIIMGMAGQFAIPMFDITLAKASGDTSLVLLCDRRG